MGFMNDHIDGGLSEAPISEDGNPYLNRPTLGLELVSRLVAVDENRTTAHKKLAELVTLVEEPFLHLTETDFNTSGATAYRDLKRV